MPLPEPTDLTAAAAEDEEEALARLSEELRQGLAAGEAVEPPDVAALARRHGVRQEDVRRCIAALEHLDHAARATGAPGTAEENL